MNLLTKIHTAFSWRSRPQVLAVSNALSSSELATLDVFSCQSWRDINGDLWEKYFDVMTLLSPEAFCYFLPGILKASVEEEEPNLIVAVSIVEMLDRSPDPAWWDEFFLARWPNLSRSECLVLQEWLYWLAKFKRRSVSDDSLERAVQTVELLKEREDAKGEGEDSSELLTMRSRRT